MISRVIFGLLGYLLFLPLVRPADWPQWRGENRDGVWSETGVVSKFESDRLTPVWTTSVGAGYSGPTVSGDRVFLTSYLKEPKQVEQVHCVDRLTGKEIWKYVYDCEYQDIGYLLGPRTAVAISDGKAYSYGAMGMLTVSMWKAGK